MPGTEAGKVVNVRLVGILCALSSREAIRRTVYSPIGSMTDGTVKGVQHRHELGPLKKCAEGDC
jgi:hypothetical protein